MFFHAWENHDDRHQSPEQQQEGESQPAHGRVVRWWAAWWQEAGGRATQTGRLGRRRGGELAQPLCKFLYYETRVSGVRDNQGNACTACKHCGWEQTKQTAMNLSLGQPSCLFCTRIKRQMDYSGDSTAIKIKKKPLILSFSYLALERGWQRIPAWFTGRLLRDVWSTEAETAAEISLRLTKEVHEPWV